MSLAIVAGLCIIKMLAHFHKNEMRAEGNFVSRLVLRLLFLLVLLFSFRCIIGFCCSFQRGLGFIELSLGLRQGLLRLFTGFSRLLCSLCGLLRGPRSFLRRSSRIQGFLTHRLCLVCSFLRSHSFFFRLCAGRGCSTFPVLLLRIERFGLLIRFCLASFSGYERRLGFLQFRSRAGRLCLLPLVRSSGFICGFSGFLGNGLRCFHRSSGCICRCLLFGNSSIRRPLILSSLVCCSFSCIIPFRSFFGNGCFCFRQSLSGSLLRALCFRKSSSRRLQIALSLCQNTIGSLQTALCFCQYAPGSIFGFLGSLALALRCFHGNIGRFSGISRGSRIRRCFF